MTPFLLSLARAMHGEHGHALRDVAVVLPSHRAGLYLRRHLAEVLGRASWSPEMFTFPELMERLSGLRACDTQQALLEMYTVHGQLRPQATGPLAEFLHWGPVTLRDMSEVDAHRLDHGRFYRDLRALEEVEQWSLRLNDDLSAGQERLVAYWELKRDLHAALNERLAARGLGLAGAVERMAADRLEQDRAPIPWKAVWIAGANALTTAQRAVLGQLRKRGSSRCAWDSDRFYLEDRLQEAGRYLRPLIQEHGAGVIPPSDDLRVFQRRITRVHAPNAVAQCHAAAQMVSALDEEERGRTAVVLADETLVVPLLRALPPEVTPVNVTMGLTLHSLPVSAMIEVLLRIHERGVAKGIHRSDLESLLLHPFLQQHGNEHLHDLVERMRADQRAFVRFDDLQGLLAAWPGEDRTRLLDVLTPLRIGGEELPERILALIEWARDRTMGDVFADEQLYHAAQAQLRLRELLRDGGSMFDVDAVAQLHRRVLRLERISFHGEPLKGLQIMGMLETRAIDNDRLIVVNAMEGVLPPGDAGNSFIPFDVRRAFELPLQADTDAVSAYGLLRAMQRASEVVFITHGGDEQAEPSRFIAQLTQELDGRSNTVFSRVDVSLPGSDRDIHTVVVPKTEAVVQRITARLERGLSPTAITSYLNCPLDFWFRHVLGMRQNNAVDERLGDDRVGTAVHEVLEGIFKPWVGTELSVTGLRAAAQEVMPRLHHAMERTAPGCAITEGQPMLQAAMAAEAIRRYLESEAGRVERGETVVIEAVEQAVRIPLIVRSDGTERLVPIIGKIDRVERRNGQVHIADVKTGNITQGDLSVRDLARIGRHKTYAIQLLVYAWAWLRSHPEAATVTAGVIPMRRPAGVDGPTLRIGGREHIGGEHLPAIEEMINAMITELLDPALPIRHDTESDHCAFCLAGK